MELKKTDLDQALSILSAGASVFVPTTKDGVKRFQLWEKDLLVELDGDNTLLPPKDILFPCTEKMYHYRLGEDISIKEVVDAPAQIIFGVRPCDMQSIDCMDKVFLEKGYVDSYYERKRQNVVLFAYGCPGASRTCFCDSMGIDPNSAPNADVMMWDGGDVLVLKSQTPKGASSLEKLNTLLKKGGKARSKTKCSLKVEMSETLPQKLSKMFEHPIWRETADACIGCATCTYVCPTCYCFDIDSDSHGAVGTKYRCWDSCMFSDYNRMAGGHNPRPTKKERVRNRYLHKLSFFKDRYGQLLCVGCGRCIEKCPAHMDISAFIDNAAKAEPQE